ncbi:MAG: carboxylating nicotinate-nucleotide diphosphorylase [Elusimicrobia bacterium]|nr:carboxylating nicotinate-nucleotide diphosphorylase [Elusimicrobiota bacterium]
MRAERALAARVRAALAEDLGPAGDLTTRHFLPAGRSYRAFIKAKAEGVLCGVPAAAETFRQTCPRAKVRWLAKDGDRVRPGQVVARIAGPREILTAERVALNFLQHLSGIATLARRYAEAVRGTRAKVYDTRKTLPGWRALAKAAVKAGGAENHRMGLHDMVLLKDNHWAGTTPEALARKVAAFRRRRPGVPVQVEADSLERVRLSLGLKPDLILLDNMGPRLLRRAIALVRRQAPRVKVEVSGGVDLHTVRALALLGPDRISVGRLTHSAPALDLSMKIETP